MNIIKNIIYLLDWGIPINITCSLKELQLIEIESWNLDIEVSETVQSLGPDEEGGGSEIKVALIFDSWGQVP